MEVNPLFEIERSHSFTSTYQFLTNKTQIKYFYDLKMREQIYFGSLGEELYSSVSFLKSVPIKPVELVGIPRRQKFRKGRSPGGALWGELRRIAFISLYQ